jgi:hypothetical protein
MSKLKETTQVVIGTTTELTGIRNRVGQRLFVARHFLGFVGHDKAVPDLQDCIFHITKQDGTFEIVNNLQNVSGELKKPVCL